MRDVASEKRKGREKAIEVILIMKKGVGRMEKRTEGDN